MATEALSLRQTYKHCHEMAKRPNEGNQTVTPMGTIFTRPAASPVFHLF